MTANIDAVAEAIYERHHAGGDAPAWGELQAERRTHWCKVAQAAIDAMQLTEEWALDWVDNGGERPRLDLMPESEAKKIAASARADRNAKAVVRPVGSWVEKP